MSYSRETGASDRTGFIIFVDRQAVEAVVKDYGGRLHRNGDGIVSLARGKLWAELWVQILSGIHSSQPKLYHTIHR